MPHRTPTSDSAFTLERFNRAVGALVRQGGVIADAAKVLILALAIWPELALWLSDTIRGK